MKPATSIRKYMKHQARKSTATYRTRLFHAIRDTHRRRPTEAGRPVTNIQAGGGLYAQRIVTRKHYDLDHAKRLALGAAGLSEDDLG